jgi:hypothetical protein
MIARDATNKWKLSKSMHRVLKDLGSELHKSHRIKALCSLDYRIDFCFVAYCGQRQISALLMMLNYLPCTHKIEEGH